MFGSDLPLGAQLWAIFPKNLEAQWGGNLGNAFAFGIKHGEIVMSWEFLHVQED